MKPGLLPAVVMSFAAAWGQQIPVEGRADSAVRVLVFEDLQCSDCAAFHRMMDEKLLPRYGATVCFVHRDFPLAKHAWARKAAIAARYFDAIKPELGLEFRRTTFRRLAGISRSGFDRHLAGFAGEHAVDPAQALAALSDERLAALVEKDFQEGVARGVSKTPTVFVNGTPFVETFTFEEISAAIERALAENR